MDENTEFTTERQFPRFPFQRTPWIFTLEIVDAEFMNSPVQLEALNISLGGLKFHSNKKIAIFNEVSIRLVDKEGRASPLTLSGKVIRVEETDVGLEEKTFGMAIEFSELHSETKQKLSTILTSLPQPNLAWEDED